MASEQILPTGTAGIHHGARAQGSAGGGASPAALLGVCAAVLLSADAAWDALQMAGGPTGAVNPPE